MRNVLHLTTDYIEQLKAYTSLAAKDKNLVLILCAAWCGTCTSFKPIANELASLFDHATFIWLDVEDDSEVAGEVDVANFPSIAVFREEVPIHYGVSLPHQGVVKRLLKALLANPIQHADIPQEVAELPEKITEWIAKHS